MPKNFPNKTGLIGAQSFSIVDTKLV